MKNLYLLGSGTPTPTRGRYGTCHVLELDDDFIMIDCGPASTWKLVRAGLFPTQIDWLLFTHHHFDHDADYPCFLLCRWDQSHGQQNKLKVFGPPPTRQMTGRLIGRQGAFVQDWKARCGAPVSQHVHKNRGGTLPRPEPEVDVTDISPGLVHDTGQWKASAAAAQHVEPWLISLAYRIQYGNRSIVFAGDTGPCSTVTDLARGCDMLVVNCWDHQDEMDVNGEGQGQTGTRGAANFGADSGAGTLVLTHTGPRLCRPGDRERAIAEIASTYKGRVIFGEEGMKLPLE